MGRYYDVEKIENGNFKKVKITNGKEQPKFNNRLVAVCDKLVRKIAVDLTDKSEWDHFYKQYFDGLIVNMYLYDIPENVDIDQSWAE